MPARPKHALSAAFEAFYHHHFAFVWRALWRLGVPEAAVDDATQDVFVVAHRRFDALERDAARAWLFGVARRVAANYRRGDLRHRRKLAALPERELPPAPDEALSNRRALASLARAIEALHPARREVYVLIELEGLSAPEVAAALGCKLNTVYSRLRRARRDLAAALEPPALPSGRKTHA